MTKIKGSILARECKSKRELTFSFIKKKNPTASKLSSQSLLLLISAEYVTCITSCLHSGSNILWKRKMETKSSVFSTRTQEAYIPLLLSLKHHPLSSFAKPTQNFRTKVNFSKNYDWKIIKATSKFNSSPNGLIYVLVRINHSTY